MASVLRRGTFVLPDNLAVHDSQAQVLGLNQQNIMRLKVNRVALVQELQVEHILGFLTKTGVISQSDLNRIETGCSPQDRTRILLDILLTKNKASEWYKHFRQSLLNPVGDSDSKMRYKILVEFLDNTLIHRPTSQAGKFSENVGKSHRIRYPRFNPLPEIETHKTQPDVLNVEEERHMKDEPLDEDLDRMSVSSTESHKPLILIKGFFHQWIPTPDNFRSHIKTPTKHIQVLRKAGTPDDLEQISHEKRALHYMRKLEMISSLACRRRVPSGFELCLCDIVQEVLAQPQLFHLYLKHLSILGDMGIFPMKDICQSYASTLDIFVDDAASEMKHQVINTGFRLVDLLIAVEMIPQAVQVLEQIIQFIKINQGMDNLISEFKAYVQLMSLSIKYSEFDVAQKCYFSATHLTYQIQLLSFGRQLLYEGRLFQETSALFLEYGSINTAFGWARRALQNVDHEDPVTVLEAVCSAAVAYCTQWLVKKAESLAVFAVQYALENFGKHHPLYLRALSTLCHFCIEFKKDALTVQFAQELLQLTKKTFGCDTLHLASAHLIFCQALMTQHNLHEDDIYYEHAVEAVRIVRSHLPQGHALLNAYLSNFAMALQVKSSHSPMEVKISTLRWAETEARQALNIVNKHYGDVSLRAAQLHMLLGQIYSRLNDFDAAENKFLRSVEILTLCQPANSNYLLQAHAVLGAFYKASFKDKAAHHLRQVVMHVASTGYHLHWVWESFEMLIGLMKSEPDDENGEIGDSKEVSQLKAQLAIWLKENPKTETPINMMALACRPPPFQDFLEKFDIWGHAVQKVKEATRLTTETDL